MSTWASERRENLAVEQQTELAYGPGCIIVSVNGYAVRNSNDFIAHFWRIRRG